MGRNPQSNLSKIDGKYRYTTKRVMTASRGHNEYYHLIQQIAPGSMPTLHEAIKSDKIGRGQTAAGVRG